jgi:membrane protein DedA with SNARE-associated domain
MSWGLPGIFLLAVFDSAGIPLPAAVDVLVAALAAVNPRLAYAAAALAVAGSTLGCMILFYIARKGGQGYLERHTQSGWARRLRLWFRRYGLVAVFIPLLLPVPPLPTKVFVISAGALGSSPLAFLLVVLAARTSRYFGLAWLGAQLGEHSLAWLGSHGWHLSIIAVLLFVFLILLVQFTERFRRPPSGLG